MVPPLLMKKVLAVFAVTGSDNAAEGLVNVCAAVAKVLKVPVWNEVADGLTLVALTLASAGEIDIGTSEMNAMKKPRRAKRLDVNTLLSSLTLIDLLRWISCL